MSDVRLALLLTLAGCAFSTDPPSYADPGEVFALQMADAMPDGGVALIAPQLLPDPIMIDDIDAQRSSFRLEEIAVDGGAWLVVTGSRGPTGVSGVGWVDAAGVVAAALPDGIGAIAAAVPLGDELLLMGLGCLFPTDLPPADLAAGLLVTRNGAVRELSGEALGCNIAAGPAPEPDRFVVASPDPGGVTVQDFRIDGSAIEADGAARAAGVTGTVLRVEALANGVVSTVTTDGARLSHAHDDGTAVSQVTPPYPVGWWFARGDDDALRFSTDLPQPPELYRWDPATGGGLEVLASAAPVEWTEGVSWRWDGAGGWVGEERLVEADDYGLGQPTAAWWLRRVGDTLVDAPIPLEPCAVAGECGTIGESALVGAGGPPDRPIAVHLVWSWMGPTGVYATPADR